MKRSQHKQAVVALFLLGVMSLAIVFFYAQTVNIAKLLMVKKGGVIAEDEVDDAISTLNESVRNAGKTAANDVYNVMLLKFREEQGNQVDTLDTGKMTSYYEQYISRIQTMFGDKSPSISEALSKYLPEVSEGEFCISPQCNPEMILDYDESTCTIKQCTINNIVVQYVVDNTVIKEKSCSIDLDAPSVIFTDKSVDFFDYCLAGNKGVYITGPTSSFVGSIFAGVHEYEEGREAETLFGEKDPYGGLNILTTQVGIYGNSIVSKGDLNLKGAFVLFGSEDSKITIYANTLNDIENYPSKTEYTIEGDLYLRDGSVEFTNEENYNEICNMFDGTFANIEGIEDEYNSDNDRSYTCVYKKIVSNKDVTLTEDFAGVIVTEGNVIVESGCNIEGLIMAKDRIYIYGNNNIVSNKDVVKTVMTYESDHSDEQAAAGAKSISQLLGNMFHDGMAN